MSRVRIRKRVFIGCEGDSERSYARWLQSMCDEAGLAIAIDAQIAGGGDPLFVVEQSVRTLTKRERAHGRFAHKAVLLDADKLGRSPDRDGRIDRAAAKAALHLIYQRGDHEAFLLRHLPGCAALRPPAGGVAEERLRGRWEEYAKPMSAAHLAKRLDAEALRRAMTVEPELLAFLGMVGFH